MSLMKVVMVAERKAWNLIIRTIYQKQIDEEDYTLTQALEDM